MRVAELAERIERGDHRLVRGAGIGAQQHVALAVVAGYIVDMEHEATRLMDTLDKPGQGH